MESPIPTPGSSPADLLSDFFNQIFSFFEIIIRRFTTNLHASFAQVSLNRWTKVICSVIGYIIIRPYIERFFRKIHDKERAKQKQKEKEKKDAQGNKKAKVSANSLRATGGGEKGRVLGEVDNTDDEVDDDEEGEDEAIKASGVPEWGKHARKRQKKYLKNLEKGVQGRTEELTDEQILELLDWSEDEDKAGN
ncbi:Protein trafficking PGA2 [Aspergillus sclerotialis]|uniref:Protein trafficking PGA2 n=1 Tax=Aspergillus sclerotialis TaxID=2070753 RepID=A0A3A2ZAH1_9EURO|nr:Protein trafficking PGA2 [Aspergillus sclerotialis]